jgi:hypothetical protein
MQPSLLFNHYGTKFITNPKKDGTSSRKLGISAPRQKKDSVLAKYYLQNSCLFSRQEKVRHFKNN